MKIIFLIILIIIFFIPLNNMVTFGENLLLLWFSKFQRVRFTPQFWTCSWCCCCCCWHKVLNDISMNWTQSISVYYLMIVILCFSCMWGLMCSERYKLNSSFDLQVGYTLARSPTTLHRGNTQLCWCYMYDVGANNHEHMMMMMSIHWIISTITLTKLWSKWIARKYIYIYIS